jgi:hypothetical protein
MKHPPQEAGTNDLFGQTVFPTRDLNLLRTGRIDFGNLNSILSASA